MCKIFSLSEAELLYFRNKRKFCELDPQNSHFSHMQRAAICAMFDHCITYWWNLWFLQCLHCVLTAQVHPPWALIYRWELNKKIKLKCLLVHSRTEEQSLIRTSCWRFTFFCLSPLFVKKQEQSFLSKMSHLFYGYGNDLEKYQGIFDEKFVRASVYYLQLHHLCYVCTTLCKSILVTLPLIKVSLKRDLPQPT